MPSNNPYGQAISAYHNADHQADDPRTLEGRLLQKAAQQMEDLARALKAGENVPLELITDILDYNQKLWTVFVSDVAEESHPLPKTVKNNIASLGIFVFNRTRDILINPTPEKFKVLVDINRNIAAGLLKKIASTSAAGTAPPTPPASNRDLEI